MTTEVAFDLHTCVYTHTHSHTTSMHVCIYTFIVLKMCLIMPLATFIVASHCAWNKIHNPSSKHKHIQPQLYTRIIGIYPEIIKLIN